MKKLYESPEIELIKVRITEEVLGVSIDENTSSGGTIVNPGDGDVDTGDDW